MGRWATEAPQQLPVLVALPGCSTTATRPWEVAHHIPIALALWGCVWALSAHCTPHACCYPLDFPLFCFVLSRGLF